MKEEKLIPWRERENEDALVEEQEQEKKRGRIREGEEERIEERGNNHPVPSSFRHRTRFTQSHTLV